VTPDELRRHLETAGLVQREIRGMIYNPFTDIWSLGQDTDVNYLVAAVDPAAPR
jgi:2-polyprenyl-6-hydroxyphenyl methylase/3-demethylubiquinone-9 3-methyltransferase